MTSNDLSLYYDELHRWTEKDKGFRVFSGFENDTIHRFLIDTDTGSYSPDTVYKYIASAMMPISRLRCLGSDARCRSASLARDSAAFLTLVAEG